MKAFILLVVGICCRAAPQTIIPLVYTTEQTPAGVIPASSIFLPVVQRPKLLMLPTSPSIASQFAPVPAVPALPLGLSTTQYRLQDELGNVVFGHAGRPNSRSEFRITLGGQVGSFSYIDGKGKVQHRTYVTDALGTRVFSTDLPVAPNETPEVAKARGALSEMQSSSGKRSRRSVSTLPVLRYGTTPLSHFVKTSSFELPITTYSTFPSVVHVAAPGKCPNVMTPSLTTPTYEDTKITLKAIDTQNLKPATAGDLPAPFSALTQSVVAGSVSIPSVALATKPGPSTIVVKATPAQPVAAVGVRLQPTLEVAAPAPTPVFVKAAETPVAVTTGTSTVVSKSVPYPTLFKDAPAQIAKPALVFSPAAAFVDKPSPPTPIVKSAPAQAVASLGVGIPYAPTAVLVKATDNLVSSSYSPPVALATKPGPSVVVVKSAPGPHVTSISGETPPPKSPVLAKTALSQLGVRDPVSSSPVALEFKPAPTLNIAVQPAVAAADVTAQSAVSLTAPSPALIPVLEKVVDIQAVTVSDSSSAPVALASQPGPSTVVVKSVSAQPVAAIKAVAQPAATPILAKDIPTAAVAVTVPLPKPLGAPSPPAPSPEVPFRGGKFHSQDELGQYTFGHFGGSHTRVETKNVLGHTQGSFAYVNPEGEVHVRKYAAAPGLGFTVAGSDLPVDANHPVRETPSVSKVQKALLTLLPSDKEDKP